MATRRKNRSQKGSGCAGSKCAKDPRHTQLEFLRSQLLVIRDKTQRTRIQAEIRAIESAIKLAKIEEVFVKDLKKATKLVSTAPSPAAIKKTLSRFERASAAVNAAEKAFIDGSASAAGVSASEVNAYIKNLQEKEAARLRASLPRVPTGAVVIGGRLKSRRRK